MASATPAEPIDRGTTARGASFPRKARVAAIVATGVAVLAAACGGGGASTSTGPTTAVSTDAHPSTVTITLTPQGCAPKPAKVGTGRIDFTVENKDADAVSEAELRTRDLAHILGEQENLTPGLSGGFSLTVQPGTYVVYCPGASHQHANLSVTGTSRAASWKTDAALENAVSGYTAYVHANVSQLVEATQQLCAAISAGSIPSAQRAYPRARLYYERIEPVAEVWGTLDTAIDGRIDNPVTNPADLQGFHKIEQLLWADNTLAGAPAVCSALAQNEQKLLQLVSTATYDPVTMASGATDLVNEAATSKISGEEERYSNTDLIVFEANVDGAMEVFDLLEPKLQKADPALVTQVQRRYRTVESAIARDKATPGYDGTGYVEYSQVLDPQRRQLSGAVQAFAESLSGMSGQVS